MTERRRRKPFDWSMAVIAAVMVAAAAMVFLRDGKERFLAILLDDLGLFAGVLANVLAGCFIGAFVTMLLPRETITRWIGAESGLAGLLLATLAGILVPGGPFAVYPIAAALLIAGADAGAAIAFVTSWTLIGYGRLLVWELPFFGADFVTWRALAALPLPIVAGLIARVARRVFLAYRRGT